LAFSTTSYFVLGLHLQLLSLVGMLQRAPLGGAGSLALRKAVNYDCHKPLWSCFLLHMSLRP